MTINKVAHLADIHVRKVPTRNEEYEYVFNNLFKSLRKDKPDRIVVEGDIVHDYIDLGPEQIVLIKNFLDGLAKIAPVVVTMGNHDFRKKNSKRLDAIAAIIDTLGNDQITYYNKTGLYVDENITWAVWHHGQKNNNPWKTKAGKEFLKNNLIGEQQTSIDLFHDPVNGSKSATGFEMNKKSYYKLSDFEGTFSFFGDIHLQQFFDGGKKAYPGSLISQDFSEGDDQFHGYLLWEVGEYSKNGKFSVDGVPVKNEWSFKNVKLTPFIDFDDIECEIENPTKHMKIRVIWSTLPSARNKSNERKIIKYLKENYPNAIISHKNEFVEDDSIEIDDSVTIEDITQQDVQHEIFKEYLNKIGADEKLIKDIIDLDEDITSKIDVDANTNIEWNIIKFGGKNFMSYEDINIDWRDKDGLYQITGENTAGKTTILKLISYILFSKTLETESRMKFGDARFVNNKNDLDFCSGYIVLEANGEYYGIKRKTDISRNKNAEINGAPTKIAYYKLSSPDDEMNDANCIDALTDDNKVKTQKRINEIIGSYDNFIRIVMTTSDTLNRILSNDMAVFVDSLLYDSGLDIFDKKLTEVKEHIKELNKKSKIVCNIVSVEEQNKVLAFEISETTKNVNNIKDVKLVEVNKNIVIGDEYVDKLNKKLFNIDDEIANLNVPNTQRSVNTHELEIVQLKQRKLNLENGISLLKETYDVDRLNELIVKKDEHKDSEYNLRLSIKEIQQKTRNVDHNIEIVNGKIHVLKINGGNKKKEAIKLKGSKTCPTCGQLMTAEHRTHIDSNIKILDGEMYLIGDEINAHQKTIDEVHKPTIVEYGTEIENIDKKIVEMSREMEGVLVEIGKITNDKNDVEKRGELQNELNQIPTKIQNEDLKKTLLITKINNYNNSLKQIEENKKINKGIVASKERIAILRGNVTDLTHEMFLDNNTIKQDQEKIDSNIILIKEFNEQEYQNKVVELYKKCVHRDGIPRQLLSNYIIPKINVELENVLSVAPFKVWLDVADLRPKLSYYNTPHAVIDAISSSGKERTFASVVLKLALNEINVKSKPTIFLLDEVMGKLSEGSVEEFVQIIQIIKEKCKKFLIIEHIHEVHPDFVIHATRTEEGISSAVIE